MFPPSCVLLWLAVVTSHQQVFTYTKQWDPFRRSLTQCEMCYKEDCVLTDGPRCEYYADATKLTDDDSDDGMEHEVDGDKVDDMMFDLVLSGSSARYFNGCIPLVSHYTDCTQENICTGCNLCSCNEGGRWICSGKQTCRPQPQFKVDNRIIGIVIDNLKRKEKTNQNRVKRSLNNRILNNMKHKLTDDDEIGNRAQITPTAAIETALITGNKKDNYIDLLEFNDILQSWSNDFITKKPITITDSPTNFNVQLYKDIHGTHLNDFEYDPIRLIKRDISEHETPTVIPTNTTSNNFTYESIFSDAIKGLHKITNEKQKELEELMNIQSNLLTLAKEHNIAIDTNSTIDPDDYNKHHIAIYKLDTLEKCDKVKHDICSAIADVIKSDTITNSSDLPQDIKLIFSTIKKYMSQEIVNDDANVLPSHQYGQEQQKHIESNNKYRYFNPIILMSNILSEINKTLGNPLSSRSHRLNKILKRVVKQLYFDDFAVIDYIVRETYYDFDSYLENIGIKWNKMIQDVIDSNVFDTLYKIKLLHMTLSADISKMEDTITLLDFARNRRMTIANGLTIDKSILRIQNNLQLIDSNVQKIMKFEKLKRTRPTSAVTQSKPAKKKSILQKFKKMFQSSKNDIKEMLRKKFPKSEIIKRIAKKKFDELETRKMLDYQATIKDWQEAQVRKKRFVWGIKAVAERIKSIIPGYLRRKVNPAIHKSKGNKTQNRKTQERKQKRLKSTTVKANIPQNPSES